MLQKRLFLPLRSSLILPVCSRSSATRYVSVKRLESQGLGGRCAATLSRRNSNKTGVLLYALLALVGSGGLAWQFSKTSSENGRIFDPPKFTPFTLVAKQEISSTNFILTLRPPHRTSKPKTEQSDPYENEWKVGTWSVEVKQPQLQIARAYTPLPPNDETAPGDLRFFIRRDGEVSSYLSNLPMGAQVDLRGPYPGLELQDNLKEVVFLAGGTGIAPALQVACTLLQRTSTQRGAPRIKILWASRRREDCIGGAAPLRDSVAQDLKSLQARYPGYFTVDYLVDDEGTYINAKRLAAVTRDNTKEKASTALGSKLVIVSGPEGFVNFLAGPKKWVGGRETQGERGGLIKRTLSQDWTVWKL